MAAISWRRFLGVRFSVVEFGMGRLRVAVTPLVFTYPERTGSVANLPATSRSTAFRSENNLDVTLGAVLPFRLRTATESNHKMG